MKKIIASLIAIATVFSLSTAAFAEAPAADPGSTNGKQEQKATVEEGKPTEVVLDNGVKVVAEEGAFPAGTEVNVVADPQPVDAAAEATKVEAIDKAVKELVADAGDIQVVTKIDISIVDAEGNVIQPAEGKKVTITVAWDGVSNAIAYVGEKVEFLPLTVDKTNNTATFEVSHFSDYFMVSVSDDVVKAISGGADDNQPSKDDDKNKPTGVALAIVPAAIAAAAVVVSKKRK